MLFDNWQKWITIIGLVLSLIGVIRMLPDRFHLFIGWFEFVLNKLNSSDFKRVKKNKIEFDKAQSILSSAHAGSFRKQFASSKIKWIKRNSKLIAFSAEKLARDHSIKFDPIIGEDGIIDPIAYQQLINDHTHIFNNLNILATEKRDEEDSISLARAGLVWIFWGVFLQLVGALPL